jgi:protein O-GlcNAc transferase
MQTIQSHLSQIFCPSALYTEAQAYLSTSNYINALENLEICCKCDPLNFHYWLLSADCFDHLNLRQESLKAYKIASNLLNNSFLSNRIGELSKDLGMIEESLHYYSLSIAQDLKNFHAYNNKGNLLRSLGRYPEAIETFSQGLVKCGANQHLYNNLGNCFIELEMMKEARFCYGEALKVEPSMVEAHCNLSAVLKAEGRINEAISCCSIALSIDPSSSDAYACMGNILKDTADLNQSILFYQKAVLLDPRSLSSVFNLANLLKDAGDITQAIHFYEKTLEIAPNHCEAFCNLVYSRIFICDWQDIHQNFERLAQVIKHQVDSGTLPSVQPFHTFAYPLAPEDKLVISKTYAKFTEKLVKAFCPFPKSLKNNRIRVGYVSSDFVDHPLCHLMQSVFSMHDRTNFEVYIFAISPDDGSEYRANVKKGSDFFFDFSTIQHPMDLASEIYKNRIDVLFNLNGFTRGSRNEIFALRPGKVQISYMGFAGSLGADYIEYLVSDKFTSPPSLSYLYSEKLIWMPHSYFVNDHLQSSRYVLSNERPTREGLLPQDKFVFANFNQLYKIDPDTFDIWMKILKRVPESVLWLLRFPAAGEENIKKHAACRGVDPRRIWFTDVTRKKEHVNRCYLADLCLDTPLCNGHTTTCDLLWSGLPMITLPLNTLASRVASGLCYAVEMPEFVVRNSDEYEETAVRLAIGISDMAQEDDLPDSIKTRKGSTELKRLRHKLSIKRLTSPCFNTKLWVTNLEKALKLVVKLDSQGENPRHIEVIDN